MNLPMDRFIPEEQILEIQRATDIAELIGGYIPLKKLGTNYKALCPFHDEKTPSFTVSPQKQIYHCFGCHKGGNVFTFLMAFEKVTFIEAVKILAERSGIKLNLKGSTEAESATKQRAESLKLNHWVMNYYHKTLTGSEEGKLARNYLAKRGFNQGTIGRFLLGFAPAGWDNLINAAKENGFKESKLLELGLILPRKEGRGYYDRFRNRLMFPILNMRDRVVGFGGRALDTSEPVYLNSPESPLFSKGKTLYGLNFAKDSAAKKGFLCIVEGYTDVMMAHQSGFEWVVATLGTALTEHHIRLLRRYVNKVVLVYDADVAGEMASARTLDLFLAEEIDLNIAEMPKGLDPYDCIVQKGAETFAHAIDNAKDLFSYRVAAVKNKYNLNNINEKTKAIDEVLETVNTIPNVIKRDLLIKRLAEETQTKETALRMRLKERESLKRFAPMAKQVSSLLPKTNTAEAMALKNIIEIMLKENKTIPIVKEALATEDVSNTLYNKIIQESIRLYDKYDKVTLETLLTSLSEDSNLVNEVVEIVERDTLCDKPDCETYLRNQLSFFTKRHKELKEMPLVKQRLKEVDLEKGDVESSRNRWNEYLNLRRELARNKKK